MVEYWHWHSIHNSFETYWKGLLSHDFKENETYRAAKQIGLEFAGLGSHLINLKKHNRVALLLSNESLTALDWFPIRENEDGSKFRYNDVVRYIYDALYEINVECDILWPESEELSDYDLLILPALYTADEKLLLRIADYVEQGGHLLATFKTAFTNENVKVYCNIKQNLKAELDTLKGDITGEIKDALESSTLKTEEKAPVKHKDTFLNVMSILIFIGVLADIALRVLEMLGIL